MDIWLISRAKYWVDHVTQWSASEDILLLRFEDIVRKTQEIGEIISSFLDMPIRNETISLPPKTKSLWHNRLQRLSSNPISTEIRSITKPEPIKDLVSAETFENFLEIVSPLCVKLGYEHESSNPHS